MEKIKAFTLAEVLITLAIIGVVAALTIPTVITNYQKNMYVTQLKKEYNYITNAFHAAMARDGVMQLSDTQLWSKLTDDWTGTSMIAANPAIKNEISKIFNITTIYDGSTNKLPVENNRILYKFVSGSNISIGSNIISEFICLADGACFNIHFNKIPENTRCGEEHLCASLKEFQAYYNTPTKLWQKAGFISIDVNGFQKGPNQMGRDYFYFYIGNDGNLYPDYGIDLNVFYGNSYSEVLETYDNNSICNPSDAYSGSGCQARIMSEGWKMNY